MRKIYLKRLMLSMLLSVGMLSSLLAATIVVTNINDSGEGSLRQAVMDAAPGDEIIFATSTNNQNLLLTSGEIVIDKNLTITGNGRTRTNLSGNQTNRVFNITEAVTVLLRNMRLQNGRTNLSGGALQNVAGIVFLRNVIVRSSIATGADATQGGGGIHNRGTMTIRDCVISGNTASGASGSGGGILNAGNGSLNVTLSSIVNNTANRAGGGIEDASGTESQVNLRIVLVDGNTVNTAPGNGGGIHIGGGNFEMAGGSVSNNTAGSEGGGLWNGSGTMYIRGVTIDNNEANGTEADNGGGGIYNDGGILRVDFGNTITNNRAMMGSASGGGILIAEGGRFSAVRSTISDNTASRAGGGIEDASGGAFRTSVRMSAINNNTVLTSPGNGGGIHLGGESSMTVQRCTLTGNLAGAEGGAIWNGTGSLSIRDTEIDGNTASGDDADQGGGGLYNDGGTIRLIDNVTITNNTADGTAGSGGGILNNIGGTLFVFGSTIDKNTANRAGGGIEDASGAGSMFYMRGNSVDTNSVAAAPGNGGGIHIGGDGRLTFSRGTVNANTAAAEGGGVWLGSGGLFVYASTIDGNTASGDDADQGGGGIYSDGGGRVNVIAGSVISNNTADGASGSGGGVFNNTGASLRLSDTDLTANTANRAGGAIEDASGSGTLVNLRRVDFVGNTVNGESANPGNGGALHVTGNGDVLYVGGTVNANLAATEGGGFWNGGGLMRIDDVVFSANVAAGDESTDGGGGLFNLSGDLQIQNTTFIENDATGASGSGGAILSLAGDVRVSNSDFTENTATRAGGAVELVVGNYTSNSTNYDDNVTGAAPGRGGAFHITGDDGATPSTVSFNAGNFINNTAVNQGGAVWNQAGVSMSFTSVEFVNNRVPSASVDIIERIAGGAVYNNGGTVDITSSTFEGNNLQSATGNVTAGGAIANDDGGVMTLTTSTLSGNSASIGGGIANAATLTVVNSTITNNNAGRAGGIAQSVVLVSTTGSAVLNIEGTILAGNTSGDNPNFEQDGGTTTSGGYNLIGQDPNNEFPLVATDVKVTTTRLGNLQNNGGTVRTIRPRCGTGGTPNSPAINGGDPNDFTVDQLGNPVFGGRRDIGAYERQTACPSGVVGGPSSDLIGTSSAITAQAFSVYPNPARTGVLNVLLPDGLGGDITVKVFDASGRTLNLIETTADGTYSMDILSLEPGTYGLQVVSGEQVEQTLFVVAQ